MKCWTKLSEGARVQIVLPRSQLRPDPEALLISMLPRVIAYLKSQTIGTVRVTGFTQFDAMGFWSGSEGSGHEVNVVVQIDVQLDPRSPELIQAVQKWCEDIHKMYGSNETTWQEKIWCSIESVWATFGSRTGQMIEDAQRQAEKVRQHCGEDGLVGWLLDVGTGEQWYCEAEIASGADRFIVVATPWKKNKPAHGVVMAGAVREGGSIEWREPWVVVQQADGRMQPVRRGTEWERYVEVFRSLVGGFDSKRIGPQGRKSSVVEGCVRERCREIRAYVETQRKRGKREDAAGVQSV